MRRLMTMWLCATACILTVAQDIPEKIYVNRYSSEKRVDVVNGKYVDSITVKLGSVGLLDSLRIHITDGTMRGYKIRSIDSVSIDEPRDLLLKELTYYNKISNKRIPTYADSYAHISGWHQRAQWNLDWGNDKF